MTGLCQKLKDVANKAIDVSSHELALISDSIWNKPELFYEEHHAHEVLTNFLEKHDFNVKRHAIVDTGFIAEAGHTGVESPNLAVLCEFDALPEIGHACGHNLIAEAGIGAAIGIKAALDAAKADGPDLGKLTVFGTPAEEGGGGKIDFIQAGAFDSIDAAMMVHPGRSSAIKQDSKLAITSVELKFIGRASHAAGFPWEGINALDAAVMAYTSVSVMRQQMKPDWRVHGIITNGGAKPNIIPELTEMEYYLRAQTMPQVKQLKERFIKCIEAAALSTDCQLEMTWDPKPYENLLSNPSLSELYEQNILQVDPEFWAVSVGDRKRGTSGSTDMGNVSHIRPAIHPTFYIGTDSVAHSRQFAQAAGDPNAQSYTLNQAKAMAMTAIDIYCQPDLVQQMHDELKQQLNAEKNL